MTYETNGERPPPFPHEPHRTCSHRFYGMTCQEYDALFESQGRACGVCQGTQWPSRLVIDHDHALGKQYVRGIICHRCNTGCVMMSDAGRWPLTPRLVAYRENAWHLAHRTDLHVEQAS